MRNNKYGVYTLGVGFLLLAGVISPLAVSSNLSPANKSIQRSDFDNQEDAIEKSPGTHRGKFKTENKDQQAAIKSLSPKNQTVFQTLSNEDKDTVVQAHKKGGSAHRKLTDVLNQDAKKHSVKKLKTSSSNKNSNSPASKAMNKQRKQNIYD